MINTKKTTTPTKFKFKMQDFFCLLTFQCQIKVTASLPCRPEVPASSYLLHVMLLQVIETEALLILMTEALSVPG